jgi:hypothetical protein
MRSHVVPRNLTCRHPKTGTALTCFALYNAWRASRRGDRAQVQRMFRARIGAQAFTVCAIVAGGAYYGQDREKRKELIKLEAQQRAEDRHQKWLRELEVRDGEEKQLRDHLKRRQERVQAKRVEETKGTDGGSNTSLVAETTSDAEGQVPVQENKEGSGVLGALTSAGGWFGTGKNTPSNPAEEEKKPTEDTPKK